MRCAICNEALMPKEAWKEVAGYMRPTHLTGNSGSSLIDRKPTGKAICSGCATDIQADVAPGQSSFRMTSR